jgi:hypothetical protein
VTFFVNGATSGATGQNAGTPATGTTLTIGNRASDAARGWDGRIDEVRRYNVILTAAEIKQLYRMGATPRGLK